MYAVASDQGAARIRTLNRARSMLDTEKSPKEKSRSLSGFFRAVIRRSYFFSFASASPFSTIGLVTCTFAFFFNTSR